MNVRQQQTTLADSQFSGTLSPVVTSFATHLSVEPDRFIRHCQWLLKSGCSALTIFGTNSEANSLPVDEKLDLLECLIEAGASPKADAGHRRLRTARCCSHNLPLLAGRRCWANSTSVCRRSLSVSLNESGSALKIAVKAR